MVAWDKCTVLYEKCTYQSVSMTTVKGPLYCKNTNAQILLMRIKPTHAYCMLHVRCLLFKDYDDKNQLYIHPRHPLHHFSLDLRGPLFPNIEQ